MVKFDGQVAVVTGAGTGLGREYALLLARRGARVVVNDLGGSVADDGTTSARAADAVVDEIRSAGGEAIASYDSVAEAKGAQSIIDAALVKWGQLDILINNAGILREGLLQEMSLDSIERVMAVHLMGTLYCTRAALIPMFERSYGRIVLTSSASGLMGNVNQAVYGAAKAGMVGLMNCVKLSAERQGVLINTVVPSADTRMSKGLIRDELARNMSPHLVAPMVGWYASSNCRTSGEVVNACGGYFFRIAYYKSRGVQFDPRRPITLEMIDEERDKISDMNGLEPYKGTIASLEPSLRQIGTL
jgi:NAD(P)-dependent dehydrogenase (short-subunit alcohol dehydrogenase family)